MSKRDSVLQLEGLKGDLQRQINRLQEQLAGVELAIGTLSGVAQGAKQERTNVRTTLLRILESEGEKGINAAIAVEISARQNVRLEKATVASVLSRLKAEGLAVYDGSLYRPSYSASNQSAKTKEFLELLEGRQ